MLDKLKEIFNAMSKQVQSHPELAEHRKADMRALDLFVTTSDTRGQEWHVYDQMGADIWGKKNLVHRFHLRYRTHFSERRTNNRFNRGCIFKAQLYRK
ncbi:hypothetical protein GCM10020331_101930 [Ectobacillus funiculus]